MKRRKNRVGSILFLTGMLFCFAFGLKAAAAGGVPLDSTNFPDETFRNFIKTKYDYNGDGTLSQGEIGKIVKLVLKNKSIGSLKGIENFSSMRTLTCTDNALTSLDLRGCSALETLACGNNSLKSLNVSGCSSLKELSCENNQLTALNVTQNTLLTTLNCSRNRLTSLNVTYNTALETLDCSNNALTSLNVTKNTALKTLDCGKNSLTSLNVTKNAALIELNAYNNALSTLNVGKNSNLSRLDCRNNKLKELDVTKNTKLRRVNCACNQISVLDISAAERIEPEEGFIYGASSSIQYRDRSQVVECRDIYWDVFFVAVDKSVLVIRGTGSGYEGDPVSFYCDFLDDYPYSYDQLDHVYWQVSTNGGETWENVPSTYTGYNRATLQLTATASREGNLYRCVGVYDAGEDSSPRIYTRKMFGAYVLRNLPAVFTQPKSTSAVVGASASFSVTAGGTGLTYRWQVSKDKGVTWKDVTSANEGYNTATLKLVVKDTWNGYRYRCTIKDSYGKTIRSASAKLTVNPKITAQPSGASAYVGAAAVYSVTATGAGLTYRWQVSKDAGSTWKDVTDRNEGYNTATLKLTVKDTWNGYRYRCHITDANGKTLNSTGVKLTVKPKITAQPAARSAYVGGAARFSVTATGAGLKYRWQVSKDAGETWKDVTSANEGYNTATLKLVVKAAWNGYRYRCVITDANGKKLNSNGAKLTVK
nr:hypothetical protein [Lachnospiraceae bacterium]